MSKLYQKMDLRLFTGDQRRELQKVNNFLLEVSRSLSSNTTPATTVSTGAAPDNASYVTVSAEAALSAERALGATSPIVRSDSGSAVTISFDASTVVLTEYLNRDGTTELTADWDAGANRITAETFTSDVATGTAPFVVASTTLVTNLNADQVDGLDEPDLVLTDGTNALTANWAAGAFDISSKTFSVLGSIAAGEQINLGATGVYIGELTSSFVIGFPSNATFVSTAGVIVPNTGAFEVSGRSKLTSTAILFTPSSAATFKIDVDDAFQVYDNSTVTPRSRSLAEIFWDKTAPHAGNMFTMRTADTTMFNYSTLGMQSNLLDGSNSASTGTSNRVYQQVSGVPGGAKTPLVIWDTDLSIISNPDATLHNPTTGKAEFVYEWWVNGNIVGGFGGSSFLSADLRLNGTDPAILFVGGADTGTLGYDEASTAFTLDRALNAPTLESTVATGTAPLTVASTTVVANLNADLLDGISEGSFLRSDATDSYTSGTLSLASGTTLASADNVKHIFGTGSDAEIYYDGTDLIIDPDAVGSGILRIDGDEQVDGFFSMGAVPGASNCRFQVHWSDGTLSGKHGLFLAITNKLDGGGITYGARGFSQSTATAGGLGTSYYGLEGNAFFQDATNTVAADVVGVNAIGKLFDRSSATDGQVIGARTISTVSFGAGKGVTNQIGCLVVPTWDSTFAGTVGSAYGLLIDPSFHASATGTISNYYALRIRHDDDMNNGATLSNYRGSIQVDALPTNLQNALWGNIYMAGGDYNTGHLKLDGEHVWQDQTNSILRWSNATPAATTSGVGIGETGETGAQTPTLSANLPAAAAGTASATWIPIWIGATKGWIPVWQ